MVVVKVWFEEFWVRIKSARVNVENFQHDFAFIDVY